MIDTSLLGITLHTGYVNKLGIEFPRTSEIFTDMKTWFLERFGSDFDIRSETAAGRMIEGATMLISRMLGRNAYSYNQLNVNYATGKYLDTIGSLLNVTRESATPSRKRCTFYGTPDCTIGAGSYAFTKDGMRYLVENDVEMNGNTSSRGYVVSEEYDAVEIGDVTVVGERKNLSDGTPCSGTWTGVESTGATFVGSPMESDASMRKRIRAKMALARPFLSRVREELESIPGVVSSFVYVNGSGLPCYVTEENEIKTDYNDVAPILNVPTWEEAAASSYVRNSATIYGGLTYRFDPEDQTKQHPTVPWTASEWREVPRATPVEKHSVFVSIDEDLTLAGGLTQEQLEEKIAHVLYACKSSGAGMTPGLMPHGTAAADNPANIPVDPSETNERYNRCVRIVNYRPSGVNCTYRITFNLPDVVRFYVGVTVKKNQYLGSQLENDIKQAVLKWKQNKVPYVDGLVVGQSVYPFEIGNAISDVIPDIQVVNVDVGIATRIGTDGLRQVVAQDHIPVAPSQKGDIEYTYDETTGVWTTNDVIVKILSN